MTDPRVLVRLDSLVGLLAIIAVLLSAHLIVAAADVGLLVVLALAAGSAIASAWYRRELDQAAE